MIGSFRIKIPATAANIGPGFDSLGFAIDKYLTVEVREGSGNIRLLGRAKGIRESDNAVLEGMKQAEKIIGRSLPSLNIEIDSEIPLRGGLGSSAAARVGGLFAANKILKGNLSVEEIAEFAAGLEGHPDNAFPAALGGFTVCCSTEDGVKFINHKIDEGLKVVVGVPEIEVVTEKARKILPGKIAFQDAVYSNSRSCLLVSALLQKEYGLLKWAMDDKLHQPYRKKFIPGFDEIVRETKREGAFGTAISGSGPAVFSFSTAGKTERIVSVMVRLWQAKGVKANFFVASPVNKGVHLFE